MANPGAGPRVPGATCLECRSVRTGGRWLPAPLAPSQHTSCPEALALAARSTAAQQGLRPYTYSVLPIGLSTSLPLSLLPHCGGLVPSLSPASAEAPGSFCCSLCLLYMCLSSVSVPQSQAPFIPASQSLSPWVPWPLFLSPRTSSRVVLFKP